MSRAFMIAGSRSVLVSLWSVDSLATEALMVEFYRRMHDGKSPAAALREAKLAVRDGTAVAAEVPAVIAPAPSGRRKGKSKATAPVEPTPTAVPRDHPYYWGAFILVGG
jgi:CHAT domain-containing protein